MELRIPTCEEILAKFNPALNLPPSPARTFLFFQPSLCDGKNERVIFLFSDALVIAKPRSEGIYSEKTTMLFSPHTFVDVRGRSKNALQIAQKQGSASSLAVSASSAVKTQPNSFWICDNKQCHYITCETFSAKQQWIMSLKNCLLACAKAAGEDVSRTFGFVHRLVRSTPHSAALFCDVALIDDMVADNPSATPDFNVKFVCVVLLLFSSSLSLGFFLPFS